MNSIAYEGSTMKNLKCWKVMLVVMHCMIYFDELVFFSSAAADANRTLADERAAAGFISIDCGLTEDSRYDSVAGLHYRSDEGFIDTGVIQNIQVQFNRGGLPLHNSLRSFPEGKRNCYTLKPLQGKKSSYLIRVFFLYGNYDDKSSIPQFSLYIDVNFWTEVRPKSFGYAFFMELIYTPPGDYIHVCLVNIGSGVPFISGLELKPLNSSIYNSTSGALTKLSRFDTGSTSILDYYYSVKDDPYDRLWAVVPNTYAVWGSLSYKESMKTEITTGAYKLPPTVLKTAAIPLHDTSSLDFYYDRTRNEVVQVYWHFAEVQKLGINDSREFTISMNGKPQTGKISPKYMQASTFVSNATMTNDSFVFNITRTTKSTLPPILNALEIYVVSDFPVSATYQDDVNAIMNIKKHYAVLKGWQGDPCLPGVAWNGLNCNQDYDNHSPRITTLNLALKGLVGDIPHSLSNLTSLTYLNLSHNSLTGIIPDFLADLPSLRILDLKSNKLTGQVPTALSKKVEEGTLNLSLEDNPDLCISSPCKKKIWKKIVTILAATVVSIIFIVTATTAVWKYKQKKPGLPAGSTSVTPGSLRYTHLELIKMTNNFQNIIGAGGSGIVYHGCLQDGTPVAVKVLNPSSAHSVRLLSTEAELLARVHHRNLVSLKGYCEEGQIMALIYEHVANGNLQQHLSEKNSKVLCWKERLQIATEVAQGLEYLHSGCRPFIVHRDLKTSNILLDENFHAKISDFGISIAFSTETTESALVTKVMGTHGYLDPEYYVTQRLNKKCDVYSFGVVLLELITGHPSIIRSNDEAIHIVAWTTPKFESGDIDNIVDERLQGHFNTNSAWKALEMAMVCVSATAIQRPSMNQVLGDLKDCLAIEIDDETTRHIGNYESAYHPTLSVNNDTVAVDSSIEMGLSPR